MTSILPNGSKIPRNMSSVILKCNEPTYKRIGPTWFFGGGAGGAFAMRFFSACVCCTLIGMPNNFCPDSPNACKINSAIGFVLRIFNILYLEEMALTNGTDSGSLNSI